MYFFLDDPLNSLMVVLYHLVPALLPLPPALAVAFLASRYMRMTESAAVATTADGAAVGKEVTERAGLSGWAVVRASPPLATFCDPWRREIRLERTIFDRYTSWSSGVAAHQAALAIQAARYPWLGQFRALGVIGLKLGCGVAWLWVGSGILLLSEAVCRRGSILYLALVMALLILQRLDASAVRHIRDVGETIGVDLSSASPIERAVVASSWRDVAAAWPTDLGRIRRLGRLRVPRSS